MRAVLLLQLVAGAVALLQAPREGNNLLSTRGTLSTKDLKDDAVLEQQKGQRKEEGEKERTSRHVEHVSEVLSEASASTDVKVLKAALRLAAETGVENIDTDKAKKRLDTLQEEERKQREKESKMTRKEEEKEEDETLIARERSKMEQDKKHMEEDQLKVEERKRKRQKEDEEDRRKMEEDKQRVEEDQLKVEDDSLLEQQREHREDPDHAWAALAKALAAEKKGAAKKAKDEKNEKKEAAKNEAKDEKKGAAKNEAKDEKEHAKIEDNKMQTMEDPVKLQAKETAAKIKSQKEEQKKERARRRVERVSEILAKASAGTHVKNLQAAMRLAGEAGVKESDMVKAKERLHTLQEAEAETQKTKPEKAKEAAELAKTERTSVQKIEGQKPEGQKPAGGAVRGQEVLTRGHPSKDRIEGLETALAGAKNKLDDVRKLKERQEIQCSDKVTTDHVACQAQVKQIQDEIGVSLSQISQLEQDLSVAKSS